MGFLRRAILGGAIGGGIGYYNAAEGRGWRGAAIGGMIGAAAGGIGGGMALKGGRALAGRARGMVGSAKAAGGRFGSRLRSNLPANSFRDPVWKVQGNAFGPVKAAKGGGFPKVGSNIDRINMQDMMSTSRGPSPGKFAQNLWGAKPSSSGGFSPGWKSAAV